MHKLLVKNKGVTIIDKTLSQEECESIKTTGAQWFCDVFMKYVGAGIGITGVIMIRKAYKK